MDLESEEIRKNGSKLKLSGQPFHMLAMIAIGDGRVVTYAELQSKFWPQITIEDYKHSLGNSLFTIRKMLGDSAHEPRYVQTVPNGYRFLIPVTIIDKSSGNGSKKHHQDEILFELQDIRQSLFTARGCRDLLFLVSRCEILEKQCPQSSTMPDLQLLILDIRLALERAAILEPDWMAHSISFEAAARVFNDPNAISIPLADGTWKTLGRVSESVLLVVEHTSRQGNGLVRIRASRRAIPEERRFYEQSRKR